MANRNISSERKITFYIGTALMAFGILVFLSSFLIVGAAMLTGRPELGKYMVITGPVGMITLMIGGFIRGIGSHGLAGSGLLLDPEQAREDIEPWSRMSGGVIKDTLDEVGLDLGEIANNLTSSSDAELPFDEKLRRLHKLHEDGILTDEEYQQEKAELLENN